MAAQSDARPSAMARMAEWCIRRNKLVLFLWLLALGSAVVLSQAFAGEYNMTFSTPGAESDRAQQLLQEHFPARSGDTVEIVFEATQGVTNPAVRAEVEELLDSATEIGYVASVASPYSEEGARQISPGGTIAYATLLLSGDAQGMPAEDTAELMDLAQGASRSGLRFELSGFAIQAAQESEFSSEVIGIGVAAVILLISFGSLLAMGLPILTAIFGLGISAALIALLANFVQTPDFAPAMAMMIGIGVGIDYALFIVTRYRSALADGLPPRAAAAFATVTSGRAVLFAGCTVIIALMGLFIMDLPFLRGVALGASSAVLVAMLASITLLPAVLGMIGHSINRFSVPGFRSSGGDRQKSPSYRWSRFVQRHPWLTAAVGTAVIAVLTIPIVGLDLGFPDAGNDPEEFTTRRAYDLLTEGFGAGFNGPLFLVAEARPGIDLQESLASAANDVSGMEGVVATTPPFISPDGQVGQFIVMPGSSPQSAETEDLVNRLREDVLPGVAAATGMQVYVGGPTAAIIDSNSYVAGRLPLLIGSVIALSFILLAVVFRSPVVALKAAVMNLLSIAAAYGVVALMVQGGWFGQLFGIDNATPVPAFLPMMMFAVLFGLSMDYEVFLLSRVREEYVRTGNNTLAVADGLAATAKVITAAAAIMVSVFLAFVLGDEIFLKVLGMGLATAIFVDATIVRMMIVPSTMELLGRANWWLPAWMDRLLPEVHVEGVSAPREPTTVHAD